MFFHYYLLFTLRHACSCIIFSVEFYWCLVVLQVKKIVLDTLSTTYTMVSIDMHPQETNKEGRKNNPVGTIQKRKFVHRRNYILYEI